MKPSVIALCYRALLRIALLECVGGRGSYVLLVFTERFIFLLNMLSKVKSCGGKPALRKGLESHKQSKCLPKPWGFCSLHRFDSQPDTLRTSLKVHSCLERAIVPKGISFTSQEQSKSDLDKLCRIFWIRACIWWDPIATAKSGVWVLGIVLDSKWESVLTGDQTHWDLDFNLTALGIFTFLFSGHIQRHWFPPPYNRVWHMVEKCWDVCQVDLVVLLAARLQDGWWGAFSWPRSHGVRRLFAAPPGVGQRKAGLGREQRQGDVLLWLWTEA